MNGKDRVIFWAGSIYGSALVGFSLEPTRLLQIPMAVWIFDRNVLFNAAITLSSCPLTLHAAQAAPMPTLLLIWFCQRADIKRRAFIGLGLDRHVVEHLRQIVNRIGSMFPA